MCRCSVWERTRKSIDTPFSYCSLVIHQILPHFPVISLNTVQYRIYPNMDLQYYRSAMVTFPFQRVYGRNRSILGIFASRARTIRHWKIKNNVKNERMPRIFVRVFIVHVWKLEQILYKSVLITTRCTRTMPLIYWYWTILNEYFYRAHMTEWVWRKTQRALIENNNSMMCCWIEKLKMKRSNEHRLLNVFQMVQLTQYFVVVV